MIPDRMKVRMGCDMEIEWGSEDTVVIPLEHDLLVVRGEPCVSINFTNIGY